VGGHASIRMADLKAAFAAMGFANVRTVLASGNVVFATVQKEPALLAREIEAGLRKTFGKDIGVVVRSSGDLETLRSSDPFKGIDPTPDTRFYVTFLSEKPRPLSIAIPYSTPNGAFRILRASGGEVIGVVDLAKGKGTPEAMAILERELGSKLTTRNWNTVLKVLAGFSGMDPVPK